MAKRKDARVTVILECTSCIRNSDKKVSTGISRYITQKNRHNTPDRLELIKFPSMAFSVEIVFLLISTILDTEERVRALLNMGL